MEKPEWFETVEALEGAPDSVAPSSARAHTARLTQGFVLLGVAAVIAAGGFAFAQSSRPSADALSSVSTAAGPATSSSVVVATPVSATTPASPGVGQSAITGGKPSIIGAAAGGDDSND